MFHTIMLILMGLVIALLFPFVCWLIAGELGDQRRCQVCGKKSKYVEHFIYHGAERLDACGSCLDKYNEASQDRWDDFKPYA